MQYNNFNAMMSMDFTHLQTTQKQLHKVTTMKLVDTFIYVLVLISIVLLFTNTKSL